MRRPLQGAASFIAFLQKKQISTTVIFNAKNRATCCDADHKKMIKHYFLSSSGESSFTK